MHTASYAGIASPIVDAAYGATVHSWDLSYQLRAYAAEAGQVPDSPLLQELVYAVSYKLRPQGGNRPGRRLASSTETEAYVWPPRIRRYAGILR